MHKVIWIADDVAGMGGESFNLLSGHRRQDAQDSTVAIDLKHLSGLEHAIEQLVEIGAKIRDFDGHSGMRTLEAYACQTRIPAPVAARAACDPRTNVGP